MRFYAPGSKKCISWSAFTSLSWKIESLASYLRTYNLKKPASISCSFLSSMCASISFLLCSTSLPFGKTRTWVWLTWSSLWHVFYAMPSINLSSTKRKKFGSAQNRTLGWVQSIGLCAPPLLVSISFFSNVKWVKTSYHCEVKCCVYIPVP